MFWHLSEHSVLSLADDEQCDVTTMPIDEALGCAAGETTASAAPTPSATAQQTEARSARCDGNARARVKTRARSASAGQGVQPSGETAAMRAHRKMARWLRVAAVAQQWSGRCGHSAWREFGSDAKWVAAQPWARAAARQHTREQRRQALAVAVEAKSRDAAGAWERHASKSDGDRLVAKLREEAERAGSGGGGRGGVYVELYKILRAPMQGETQSSGDTCVRAVYIGGDKKAAVARGARAVREECRAQGAEINKARAAATQAVASIDHAVDRAR